MRSLRLIGATRLSSCAPAYLRWCRSQSTTASASGDAAEPTKASDVATNGSPETAMHASDASQQQPQQNEPLSAEKRQAAREALIAEILSRDKEIFELKRQHELSMLRVEQNQKRTLKDQEDRGMYYEQNANVVTFDAISVGLYSQRSTYYHTRGVERLRNFKLFLMVVCTLATCAYLYYRYMINPDFTYIEKPMKMVGSQVSAMRDLSWESMSDAEKIEALKEQDTLYRRQQADAQASARAAK